MPEEQDQPLTKTPPKIPLDAFKFPSGVTVRQPRTFKWILIGLIVLLLIILTGLLAWLFVLQENTELPEIVSLRPTAEENNEPESTTAEAAVVTQQAVSPSDELPSIENDLSGTNDIDLEPLFADIEAMF
jgi:hypothetical protein